MVIFFAEDDTPKPNLPYYILCFSGLVQEFKQTHPPQIETTNTTGRESHIY